MNHEEIQTVSSATLASTSIRGTTPATSRISTATAITAPSRSTIPQAALKPLQPDSQRYVTCTYFVFPVTPMIPPVSSIRYYPLSSKTLTLLPLTFSLLVASPLFCTLILLARSAILAFLHIKTPASAQL